MALELLVETLVGRATAVEAGAADVAAMRAVLQTPNRATKIGIIGGSGLDDPDILERRAEERAPRGKRLDELQRSVAAELEERLTPLESGMGDMLLKTDYKTGKLLFAMKLDEVVAALGEMNEVIGEIDPADANNPFEDSMRDMEVDVQLALAMTNACT